MPRREAATAKRRVRATERQTEAMELRKGGATYDQIGRALGITRQGAHKLVQGGMKRLIAQTTEDAIVVREMELQRLDAMLLGLWPSAKRGDAKAVDRVLRIMERRARYLGIDEAPDMSALAFIEDRESGAVDIRIVGPDGSTIEVGSGSG